MDDFREFLKGERVTVRTTTDVVLDVIRKAIETGVLSPGSRMNEESIAENLNVSRMPVRQALRALAVEGLVQHIPRVGATVTALSPADIEEIYHIRAALEGMAVRRATERYTREELAEIRRTLDQMESSDVTPDRYTELNTLFHELLYTPSGWPRLVEITVQLRRNVTRYIRSSISDPNRFRTSQKEHRAILEACEAKDSALAARLVEEHLMNVAKVLLRKLKEKEPLG